MYLIKLVFFKQDVANVQDTMWLGDCHSSVVLNYPYKGQMNQ